MTSSEHLPYVIPVPSEQVGVSPRRMRRLGLQPPERSTAEVAEGVRAPDTCPGNVARAKDDGFAVEGGLGLPLEEVVRLLEGMIMGASGSIRIVMNHEHRR